MKKFEIIFDAAAMAIATMLLTASVFRLAASLWR